ncbi:MAG: translation initiation factor IF-2 [Anaerolineae bacterium]
MAQEKQVIQLPDYLTVRGLADLIGASPIEVMKRLIANGIMASINQQIDFETAAIVVEEMGFEATSATVLAAEEARKEAATKTTQEWRQIYTTEKLENLKARPPIVTIMGHVDHGKTTLLDTIRKTKVAAGEAGGITQSIGAYRAMHGNRQITFIDTPGHEAFTQMRARGAQGADIVILVVASDDSVMPQTKEALAHARAANVPIVVAITKIDKRNANIEKVKKDLSELELTPDEWGGSTIMVPIAAQQGTGIEDLLEAILLTADSQDNIVANPKGEAGGIVLESQIDPSRGTLATLLVLNGTLESGDVIVAGQSHGRIRAMYDEYGKPVKKAEPSTPVSVLGLNERPQPGDRFERVKNDKFARQLVQERKDDAASAAGEQGGRPAITLEDIFAQFAAGKSNDLNLIIKANVQGSLQPIVDSLKDLSEKNTDGVHLRILASDIGNITENDVALAQASNAIILGFSVSVDNAARRAADAHSVDIRLYDIIYKLLEDIELAMKGLLEPKYGEKVIGLAEVRQVFRISSLGAIAGSYVREGEVRRNARARVKRSGKVLVENSPVSSLKRVKDDVREVRAGFECGIGLDNFSDFQQGDMIEFYVMERVN